MVYGTVNGPAGLPAGARLLPTGSIDRFRRVINRLAGAADPQLYSTTGVAAVVIATVFIS